MDSSNPTPAVGRLAAFKTISMVTKPRFWNTCRTYGGQCRSDKYDQLAIHAQGDRECLGDEDGSHRFVERGAVHIHGRTQRQHETSRFWRHTRVLAALHGKREGGRGRSG